MCPLLLAAEARAQVSWYLASGDPPPAVALDSGAVRLLSRLLETWVPGSAAGLAEPVRLVMVAALPGSLRTACEALVAPWQEGPDTRAPLEVRPLWGSPAGADGRTALLALRCGSTHPRKVTFVDERLAVLRLGPAGGRLAVLEDAREPRRRYFLGRFGPAREVEVRRAQGATVVRVPYTLSSDNPCCDGPDRGREEREVWVTLAPGRARLAASVVILAESEGHTHGEGSYRSVSHAEVFIEAEAGDTVAGLVLWHLRRNTFWPEPEGAAGRAPADSVVRVEGTGTTRLRWNPRTLAFDTVQPAARPENEWTRAEREIVRLEPAAFPEAPGAVRDSLAALGCRMPQSAEREEPHNLIRGRFAAPDQTDWAALCSRAGESALVVFWGGPARCRSVFAPTPDIDWLQGLGPRGIVYSQLITPRDSDSIGRLALEFGGPKPPPMDHQGIDVAFAGKASGIVYCHQGRWLALQGID